MLHINEDFYDNLSDEDSVSGNSALDEIDVDEHQESPDKYSNFLVFNFRYRDSANIYKYMVNLIAFIRKVFDIIHISRNDVGIWFLYLPGNKKDSYKYEPLKEYKAMPTIPFPDEQSLNDAATQKYSKNVYIAVGMNPVIKSSNDLINVLLKIYRNENVNTRDIVPVYDKSSHGHDGLQYCEYSGDVEHPIGNIIARLNTRYIMDINKDVRFCVRSLEPIVSKICPKTFNRLYKRYGYIDDTCYFEDNTNVPEVKGHLHAADLPDDVHIKLRAEAKGGIIDLGTKKNPVKEYKKVFEEALELVENATCDVRAYTIKPRYTDHEYFRLCLNEPFHYDKYSFIVCLDISINKKQTLIDYVEE